MKSEYKYLKFVRWEEDDRLYVGYCPYLFPWGGVCHAKSEDNAFRQLRELVQEEVQELQLAGKELHPSVLGRCAKPSRRDRKTRPTPECTPAPSIGRPQDL